VKVNPVRQNALPDVDGAVRAPQRHERGRERWSATPPRGYERRAPAGRRSALHLHWFRATSDHAFGNGSLYACRCGVVKQGI
jgi:hypothetical protein